MHTCMYYVHVCFIICCIIDEEIKQKRLEKERIDALLDMSEDEYEALPAHKRKEIDSIRHQRYMEKRRKRCRLYMYL